MTIRFINHCQCQRHHGVLESSYDADLMNLLNSPVLLMLSQR